MTTKEHDQKCLCWHCVSQVPTWDLSEEGIEALKQIVKRLYMLSCTDMTAEKRKNAATAILEDPNP